MIGASTPVHCNVLPYCIFTTRKNTDESYNGLNRIGLKRNDIDSDKCLEIEKYFKLKK